MGSLVGLVGPWSSWLPGSALFGGCWPFVVEAMSWGSWWWKPRQLVLAHWWAVRFQEIPGLVPAQWWVKPCPGASDDLPIGRVMSWVLPLGPRVSQSCYWMGLVPDTPGCGVWDVLKLVLACWWTGTGPSQSQGWGWTVGGWAGSTGCGAAVVLGLVSALWSVRLIPRLEQAHWWERPGILRLVPAHWYVDLGTRVSGCRALGSQV